MVMVLTVTSATSVALRDDPDAMRIMLLATLGTNAAWGIVDGAVQVITNVFERGRKTRLAMEITDLERREALVQIEDELESTVVSVLGPKDRRLIAAQVYAALHLASPPPARIHLDDLLGAVWVFILVFVSVLPPVLPFLLDTDLLTATLLSHAIAIAMLFVVGYWYGGYIEADRLRFALGMTSLGLVIVIITVLLGG